MAYSNRPEGYQPEGYQMESEAIANVLGRRKVLGKTVKKPDDLADLIRKGLPASSVRTLAVKPSLAIRAFEKLGIPQRTMTRHLSQRSWLAAAESDRDVRFARIYAHAVATIGDEEKGRSMASTSNRALGGERPPDRLDTDVGARKVEDVAGRIALWRL